MRYPELGGAMGGEEGKKCLDEEDDDDLCSRCEADLQPEGPPDGGWGWMVVLGAFLCNLIVDGICFSFAVVMETYVKEFDASLSSVSVVGSTLAGCYLIVGPFVSMLCTHYGCRKVTMAGSVVSMIGFALSTQASSVDMLVVTYGVIAGIGLGMIYLPSIVCVGQWFEKKRAFTTGIAVCGSGLGQFVFPPLAQYLLDKYHWEGKNLIMAGIVLNCAVCGMLFFPLEKRFVKKRRPINSKVEIERGAIMKALIEDKKRQRTISNGSLDNCIITRDNRLIKLDPKIFECKRSNSFIARFKRQLGFSSTSLSNSKNSLQGIPSIVIDAVQRDLNRTGSPIYRPAGTRVQQLSQQSTPVPKRGSLPEGFLVPSPVGASPLANGSLPTVTSNGSLPDGIPKTRSFDPLPTNDPWIQISQQNGRSVSPSIQIQEISASAMAGMTRSASDIQTASTTSSAAPSVEGSVISIQLIPNSMAGVGDLRSGNVSVRYRSTRSVGEVSSSQTTYVTTNSLVSIPQVEVEEMELEMSRRNSILWKLWRVSQDMFDLKLMINPVFFLLVLSSSLFILAFFIPYFYMPFYGNRVVGLTVPEALFLLQIIGVTNTIGRLLAGWLADRPWVNAFHFNMVFMMLGGLIMMSVPLCRDDAQLAIAAAAIGLCMGVFVALRSIILIHLLGLDMLTKSFGILILFQGIASLVGSPFAGEIIDVTGSVDSCFYLAGSMMLTSGLVLLPIMCLDKCRNKLDRGKKGHELVPQGPEDGHILQTLAVKNMLEKSRI